MGHICLVLPQQLYCSNRISKQSSSLLSSLKPILIAVWQKFTRPVCSQLSPEKQSRSGTVLIFTPRMSQQCHPQSQVSFQNKTLSDNLLCQSCTLRSCLFSFISIRSSVHPAIVSSTYPPIHHSAVCTYLSTACLSVSHSAFAFVLLHCVHIPQ